MTRLGSAESILRNIAAPLARRGISILYQSSSADDYLLVRERDIQALREIADGKGWGLDWDEMLDADRLSYAATASEAEKEIELAMQAAVPGNATTGDTSDAIIAPIPGLLEATQAIAQLEVSVDSGLGVSLLTERDLVDALGVQHRNPPAVARARPDSGVLAPALDMSFKGPSDQTSPDILSPISPDDVPTVLTSWGSDIRAADHRPPALDLRPQLPLSHLLLPSTPNHSPKTAGISVTSMPIAMVGLRAESAQEWWMGVFGLLAWPTEARRWRNLRGLGIQPVPPVAKPALLAHARPRGLGLPPPTPPAPFISYIRSPDGGSLATETELLRPLFLDDADGYLQCSDGLLRVHDDADAVENLPTASALCEDSAFLLSESMPAHLPSATSATFRGPSPERGRTRTRRRDVKSWPEPMTTSSLETVTNTASILDVPWRESGAGVSGNAGRGFDFEFSPLALPAGGAVHRPPLGPVTHSSQSLPTMSAQRNSAADEQEHAAHLAVQRDIKRCLQLDMRVVDAESDSGAYHLGESGVAPACDPRLIPCAARCARRQVRPRHVV